MARRGEVVENPITGERITFLEIAGETGGELLRFEYVLPPRFSIPEHVHPRQEERHEILSGTLGGRVGGTGSYSVMHKEPYASRAISYQPSAIRKTKS